MPSYGLLTNPSNEILDEITNVHGLDFEYVEIGIEGPEVTSNNRKEKK
jgi:hypothetical protein